MNDLPAVAMVRIRADSSLITADMTLPAVAPMTVMALTREASGDVLQHLSHDAMRPVRRPDENPGRTSVATTEFYCHENTSTIGSTSPAS